MRFQLNITLTEEDYIAFNMFHAFETEYGKKTMRKNRLVFAFLMMILSVLYVLMLGWTLSSIVAVAIFALATVLYMLWFKKSMGRAMKKQVKRMAKTGKLPFDGTSMLEFHQDKLVETAGSKRIEQGYDAIERICVVKDRFVLLYNSSVSANILPISQIEQQLDQKEFLGFLFQICRNVEYY